MIVALPRHVFYFVYFIFTKPVIFFLILTSYNIRVPSFILNELFFLFL